VAQLTWARGARPYDLRAEMPGSGRSAKIDVMRNMQCGNSRSRYGEVWTPLRLVAAALLLIGIVATGSLRQRDALAAPSPSSDRAQKHETRKAIGLVTDVEPEQMTVQTKDGTTLVLATFEDYRDRVTIGSQVTAWYYPQDNGNPVLKSLDYPLESLFVPVGTITTRIHRIVLLPNSQLPDADALYDEVRDYLHDALGWYVAPSYVGEEVRRRAQQSSSMLASTDPRTGNFDMTGYLNTSQSVTAKVATLTRSDGVLELNVIQVEAPVYRLEASWDGVEDPVAGAAFRTLAKMAMIPRRGQIPAATVELKLWDAKGNLVWRNRRGLALLEVMNGKGTRLEDRPLPVALGDGERMQHWMEAAFKSIAPGSAPTPHR